MSIGDPRLWTPARYIARDQRCHFCGADIPHTRPGTTTGTRAELASLERRAPCVERCEACAYERFSCDWADEHPLFGLSPCDGCELGTGRGLHRRCPRCAHVEHRPHRSQAEQEAA